MRQEVMDHLIAFDMYKNMINATWVRTNSDVQFIVGCIKDIIRACWRLPKDKKLLEEFILTFSNITAHRDTISFYINDKLVYEESLEC